MTAAARADVISGEAEAHAGNIVVVRGARIQLYGIEAPEPDARCESKTGAWNCGAQAKAALAKQVSGKTLECKTRQKLGHGFWQAKCFLDGAVSPNDAISGRQREG
ncbi:MAG: hypothetical protein U1F68_07220 [Gammaproteobacteria bacterium]